MDTSRLGRGETIAAISAAALVIIMFLNWFGIDIPDDAEGFIPPGLDTNANAWQSFAWIDIVMLITIIVAVGAAALTVSAQSVNSLVAISALVAVLGILSVILIIIRVINPPGGEGVGREAGVFLGLIAAAGIAYGGFKAMQEEGTSFAAPVDRLQNRGSGGGAPPPSPPADRGGESPPPEKAD